MKTAKAGGKLRELSSGRMIGMEKCVNTVYKRYGWAKTGKSACVYFGVNSKYGKICYVSILLAFNLVLVRCRSMIVKENMFIFIEINLVIISYILNLKIIDKDK